MQKLAYPLLACILLLHLEAAHAQDVAEPLAGESSSVQASADTANNPFQMAPATENEAKPAGSASEKAEKNFYRAGKKATSVSTQASPTTVTAPNPLQRTSSSASQGSAPSGGTNASSVSSEASQSAASAAPGENPESSKNSGDGTNGKGGQAAHGSASFGMGMSLGSISGYVQYISIAAVAVVGLFAFVFMRKKKGVPAMAGKGMPAPTQNKTPVDSERVRKALAAFHEEQRKPPAAPAG